MRVGTRGSDLALRQVQEVVEQLLDSFPDVRCEVCPIATRGDRHPENTIPEIGVGVFVRELEEALRRRQIDVAVHSMKDLPTEQPQDLMLAAVTKREDPRDALVNRWNAPLRELPGGARIGTGSPRRAVQLLAQRPDLQVLPIRGNVPTRLGKARGPDYDGVVVALAGLRRLGREQEAAEVFPCEVMVPAPGQGALALQVREGDEALAGLLRGIEHRDTAVAVRAERALLQVVGGGCRAAFGAYASVAGTSLTLTGMVGGQSGSSLYKATASGSVRDLLQVVRETYRQLCELGAARLLETSG